MPSSKDEIRILPMPDFDIWHTFVADHRRRIADIMRVSDEMLGLRQPRHYTNCLVWSRNFPESKNRSKRIHKKLVKRYGGEFRHELKVMAIGDNTLAKMRSLQETSHEIDED